MQRLTVSVYASSFSATATQDDVMSFVQPYKPMEVRLRCRNNDPYGAQVAFVDFLDDETANSFIAEKNYSRFMGRSMRLRMAFANNSSKSNNNNINNTNRSCQDSRAPVQNRNSQHQPPRQPSPKGRSRLREIQVPQREIVRGTFKIIAAVSNTHFVALETGWQSDMVELAAGLEDYAQYAKCGVDHMDPSTVYACKEPSSGKWRRCRKVADEAGLYVVEFIDYGGPLVVAKEQVLLLSQLYKDWSIKAVDFFLDGYRPASGSTEDHRRVQELLLNNTFQVSYLHERTGPLLRDCVHVVDLKSNGEPVLDKLVQQGLLAKRNGTQRPITKSSSRSHVQSPPIAPMRTVELPTSQKHPRVEEISQANSTTRVNKPMADSVGESDWGQWRNQCQGVQPQNDQKSKLNDGWGSVGLARDDNGTEVWNKVNAPANNQHDSPTDASDTNRTSQGWNILDWSESPMKPVPAAAKSTTSPLPAAATFSQVAKSPAVGRQLFELMKTPTKATARSEASSCQNCPKLSSKLQSLERQVYSRSAQKMISDRINAMTEELGTLKMQISRLCLSTSQSPSHAERLRLLRQAAQSLVQEIEDVMLLASPDTMAAVGQNISPEFIGKIWTPMMNLLFINEKPIEVYKNTVIRRAEIGIEQPRVAVILERAVEASRIHNFAQNLLTHKETAKIHRLFLNEDNYKAFVILDCVGSDESPDECGRRAVDLLLELAVFQ